MRKIIAGLFMSLDGVVDGDEGWQYPYFDQELGAAMAGGAHNIGALLLGRRTYEGYEALRVDNPDSPVFALIDTTPTYVVSATLSGSAHTSVSIINSDPAGQVTQLCREGNGDILVLGSPTLVRSLLSHGLLDELRLLVLPIIVGSGLQLFDRSTPRHHPLELVHSHAMRSGVLELHYTPKDH
jgi:dihydrofolate reductase